MDLRWGHKNENGARVSTINRSGPVRSGGNSLGAQSARSQRTSLTTLSQPLSRVRTAAPPAPDRTASGSLLKHQSDVARSLAKPLLTADLLCNLSPEKQRRLQDMVKQSMRSGCAVTSGGQVAPPPPPEGATAPGEWQRVGSGENAYEQRQVPAEDGGPAWTEQRNQAGEITRIRVVPDPDGGAAWTEVVRPDGEQWKNRRYTDDQGREWSETILGDNRWRQNTNAEELARQRGPNTVLTVAGPNGPLEIPIHGASPEEVEMIRRQLEALPPAMRVHVGQLTVAEDIGQILNADGTVKSTVAGFGGPQGIIIDRSQMSDPGRAAFALYHEMGHVQDYTSGDPSQRPPWGDGNGVSDYGNANNREDYAEAHREVLQLLAQRGGLAGTPSDLSTMTREEILQRYPHGERYILVLEQYGHQFPERPAHQPPHTRPGDIGFPPGGIHCPPRDIGFPPGGIHCPPRGIGFPRGGGLFPPGHHPPNFPPGCGHQMYVMQLRMMQMMLMQMMLMQMSPFQF